MKKNLFLSIIFSFCVILQSVASDTVFVRETQIPVLIERQDNVLFMLRLNAKESRVLDEVVLGEFYQFNLSSCIRQQNSLTAQFVSFSLSNLANIFYPPQFLQ